MVEPTAATPGSLVQALQHLGHYDTIHFVENSAARKSILEHLINPDLKRHLRRRDLASPPPPEVIDLPDDDGDDEIVTG